MGVYVKGMEMPESCRECPFTYWDGVTGERWCDRIIAPCNKVDCPLVEVPTPHGHLIDGAELVYKLEYVGEQDDAIYYAELAPTVIEAEGE